MIRSSERQRVSSGELFYTTRARSEGHRGDGVRISGNSAQPDRQQRGCQERGGRAHVVPRCPTAEVTCPAFSSVGSGWRECRQSLVHWHIEDHGNDETPRQVDHSTEHQEDGEWLAPLDDCGDHRGDAETGGSEKGDEEPGVDRENIDRLHGGDAFLGRKPRQRLHNKGREGEKYARDRPTAKRGHECQGIVQAAS